MIINIKKVRNFPLILFSSVINSSCVYIQLKYFIYRYRFYRYILDTNFCWYWRKLKNTKGKN